ncbi:hypothetical protein R3P38DRAFT_2858598, partial [Favolaschia claudopus]
MTNFSKLSSSIFAIAIALLLAGTANAQECVIAIAAPGLKYAALPSPAAAAWATLASVSMLPSVSTEIATTVMAEMKEALVTR